MAAEDIMDYFKTLQHLVRVKVANERLQTEAGGQAAEAADVCDESLGHFFRDKLKETADAYGNKRACDDKVFLGAAIK